MATRITGASLDPILTRLNGVDNYHPLDADTFSDWSIEAGDLVTVSRNGVNYKSPVHTSTMTWKGTTPQVQIRSSGKESRDAVSIASRKKYGKGSGAMLNSQQAYRDIITSYNNMKAGLILASSAASLYVEDMYNQMKSGLDLTSSSASLYVEDRYNQMKAGLDLTSSSASLYVEDRYNQMKSGLDLTSSSASLYVDSKYNQMKAGLDLTSSSAALYVQDAYNRMKSGLDVTSSSSALYTESKTTRAAIMTRINADGEGEALIEADKVSITGNTTLAGSLEISSGNLVVKKSANFQGNITLTTAGSTVQAPQFAVNSGGYLRLIGTQTGEHYDLTAATIVDYIKKAEVDETTHQLKLWKVSDGTDPSITFNGAVALSGAWSNGTYTVSATSGYIRGTVPSESVALGFNANNGSYYIEAIATNQSGTARTVQTSTYKLGTSGSTTGTKVQVLNSSDVRIANTPEVSVGYLYTNGQNSVNVSRGTWSGGQVTLSPSAGTGSSYTVQLVNNSPSWSGNTKTYEIWDGTSADAQHGVNTGKTITVDATARYNAGWDGCYDTLDTTGTTATKSLSYGETAYVQVAQKNSSGTKVTRVTRTYVAPSDRTFTTKTVTSPAGGGATATYYASNDGVNGYSSFTVNGVWLFSSTTKPSGVTANNGEGWTLKNTDNDKVWYYINTSRNGVAMGGEAWYSERWPSSTPYNFSVANNAQINYTDSVSGYLNFGSFSRAQMSSRTYIRFRVNCDGHYKWGYITVND